MKETRNSGSWSALPRELLACIFNRLSLADFHRAKIVCSNWNSSSKLTEVRRTESPWLILFPEGDDGCSLYNPEEDRIYKTKRDFSGIRFLANSGNWFLVVDSRSNLYIIDLFSEKRIDLPPLESHHFKEVTSDDDVCAKLNGVLWVNEKNEQEYVAVWFFNYTDQNEYLAFCKNGEDNYTEIPTRIGLRGELKGIIDIVLPGYKLYVLTASRYIRILDLSGKQAGFQDVNASNTLPLPIYFDGRITDIATKIAVTSSGEVFTVLSILGERSNRGFCIYKKDRNPVSGQYNQELDEALLMDLGITVPAIKPNSIYFTRHDRFLHHTRAPSVDICLFNLATKTLKRFPCLSALKLKDARWFLPSFGGT